MHGQFVIDYPHCMLITFGDDVTFSSRVHVLVHDVFAGTVAAKNPARLICSTEDYPSKNRDTADDLPYFDASYALQEGVALERVAETKTELRGAGSRGNIE